MLLSILSKSGSFADALDTNLSQISPKDMLKYFILAPPPLHGYVGTCGMRGRWLRDYLHKYVSGSRVVTWVTSGTAKLAALTSDGKRSNSLHLSKDIAL